MVLVDVYAAALDKTFDFGLDEEAQIFQVVEEIVEMICQSEQCSIREEEDQFMLCCAEDRQILPMRATVRACGIKTGKRLILL